MRKFESFVNSERCKTKRMRMSSKNWFESFVNSERCKTDTVQNQHHGGFESFVNSERCKTFTLQFSYSVRLRALLIQKDAKQTIDVLSHSLV